MRSLNMIIDSFRSSISHCLADVSTAHGQGNAAIESTRRVVHLEDMQLWLKTL